MTRTLAHRRGGFSFVELLFAMAILSIGMMGVAAAVYVGVDQTKSSLDDTAAAGVARQAAALMAQVITRDNTSPTGGSFIPATEVTPRTAGAPYLKDLIAPLQISGTDRRFAWSAIVRCSDDSPTADVIVVVSRNASGNDYSAKDVSIYQNGVVNPSSTNKPALVPATVVMDLKNNQITVPAGASTPLDAGAFVVLAGGGAGEYAGRILKVSGSEGGGVWSLAPGQDIADMTGELSGINGYVFGRGYADITRPEKGYAGANQAVAIYSTIVSLK